ncbi:hypothetical protein [Streptomyces azureus]|uniref:Uncharacterized protein n=1 Tax=Streptomyces azureus TaxID=146537 RepID=A0A0K8PF53_STRAJ|nr:hypothetical protein [Streptomyces azureus]GAP46522.1 uncharacterized protein SAZU_1260 [Streptomyces azureus]
MTMTRCRRWDVGAFKTACRAVAFAASPPQAGVPLADFTSPPAWADAFELGGFRLLDIGELIIPLAAADTSELAEAELEQVRYWRPGTVGELMFN